MSIKQKIAEIALNLNGIKEVEELIASKFASDVELLTEIPTYLLDLGGKRIRPLLSLIVASAFGLKSNKQELIQVSAGIELIHMATLLHDDIIDNATLRRGKTSPVLRFGKDNTLLSGDFLLVRAFSLCSKLPLAIIDATEVACIHLVEGEIMETAIKIADHNIMSSLEIARKKTASLFKLAAFSAGSLAELEDTALKHISQFGENLGIAFQILDDILDVISDEKSLGKKNGTDILEKKPSLVNMLWLDVNKEKNTTPSLARKLLLNPNPINENDKLLALEEIKNSIVIDKAKEYAINYANAAREDLKLTIKNLNNSIKINDKYLSYLDLLVDYTLQRLS